MIGDIMIDMLACIHRILMLVNEFSYTNMLAYI